MGVASSGAGHEFQPGEVQLFYVCVCVGRERERERERGGGGGKGMSGVGVASSAAGRAGFRVGEVQLLV